VKAVKRGRRGEGGGAGP